MSKIKHCGETNTVLSLQLSDNSYWILNKWGNKQQKQNILIPIIPLSNGAISCMGSHACAKSIKTSILYTGYREMYKNIYDWHITNDIQENLQSKEYYQEDGIKFKKNIQTGTKLAWDILI